MRHAFRGFASVLALALCALPVACGSGDDNGTPVEAGHDGAKDGTAPEGGGKSEGGAATEGGGATEGGAAADGGSTPDAGGNG